MREGSRGVMHSWRGRHVGDGEAAEASKRLRDLTEREWSGEREREVSEFAELFV